MEKNFALGTAIIPETFSSPLRNLFSVSTRDERSLSRVYISPYSTIKPIRIHSANSPIVTMKEYNSHLSVIFSSLNTTRIPSIDEQITKICLINDLNSSLLRSANSFSALPKSGLLSMVARFYFKMCGNGWYMLRSGFRRAFMSARTEL